LDPARHTAQDHLQRAVGEGRLTLDEFTDRVGAVWAATSAQDIDRVLVDLPAPTVGRTPAPRSTLVSVMGNLKRRGRWSLRKRTNAFLIMGDVELDLRNAVIVDDYVEITVWGLMSDVTVIVPDGVEAELDGLCVMGDREIELAPVPRVPGSPLVRVRAYALMGDATVKSESMSSTKRRRSWH
jgi:hypothetical protein